jgi:hypothetical protein
VVGNSRLMGEDEAGTMSVLSRFRKDLIEPLIAEHRGRVVKLMGDGILAEFGSVIDAVNCAGAWQNDITKGEHNPALQFRIGAHNRSRGEGPGLPITVQDCNLRSTSWPSDGCRYNQCSLVLRGV